VAEIVTPEPDALTDVLVMGVMLALYFLGVGISWLPAETAKRAAATTARRGLDERNRTIRGLRCAARSSRSSMQEQRGRRKDEKTQPPSMSSLRCRRRR